jgi:V8-like Glu-specific endopeptidase
VEATGGRDPRRRRRRHAAVGLCSGVLLTSVIGYMSGGPLLTGASAAPAPTAVSATGILPVPQEAASEAAAYWSERLSSPDPAAQPSAPRPTGSGSAPAAEVSATPLLPSPMAAARAQSPAAGSASAVPASAAAAPNSPGSPVPPVPPVPPAVPAVPAPVSAPMSVSNPLAGAPFTGIAQVGALFNTSSGSPTSHYCSGSVVSTPEGDIVVTAAHCVYDASSGGPESDIAFVPGYNSGSDPYGVWVPSAIVVSPQWIADSDPDYDVAFLVVHKSGSTTPIQDVVGADTLGTGRSYTALTEVVGYPETTDQPITCTNYTSEFSATQLEFDCDGYPGGTSGSPFLTGVNSLTGLGTVVGVIGGYETGGYSPDVSYSVYFGTAVAQLLTQAESQG